MLSDSLLSSLPGSAEKNPGLRENLKPTQADRKIEEEDFDLARVSCSEGERGRAARAGIYSECGRLEYDTLQQLNILTVLENYYDLGGPIVRINSLSGGVINDSFLAEVRSEAGSLDKFFVRAYRPGKKEHWIQLEHDALAHLSESGFQLSSSLIPSKQGRTYVGIKSEEGANERFYMVTTLLEGECPYSHEKNNLSESELCSVGETFAHLHHILSTLDSEIYSANFLPDEARMLRKFFESKLPEIRRQVSSMEEVSIDSSFVQYLSEKWPLVEKIVQRIPDRMPELLYRSLPHVPIHHDLHPGNIMFSGGVVSGVFDFDFIKIDARVFDVGLAMVFFASDLEGAREGKEILDLNRLRNFFDAYQKSGNFSLSGGLGPLSDVEKDYLPEMMILGAAMLSHWFVDDYFSKFSSGGASETSPIEEEYSDCLQLRMGLIEEIDARREELLTLFHGR